ncbi:nicotinate-nucleotide--dimethylbenzimidazole phosphoribosyltransferase [Streptomyces millisiae]|uniref:Nicotinate-nucleotide--dimethylbenzimidazole phosphoribosyltransferase n=1 Tax=Streptomyces millisiae TaxID=3075542 RepID=A0ABU2LU77_9ACTN|nr:nicotinate-nucleotide--dimethylbenzimidazole phosphoribosyltransferase [Streptomyces sp. DSM 44918]MDT0320727.1 nicotinate-nucleotide--dimethylbenzimidazole phosphoribosyltransferase [Streptomyces sp. DSM 44918]
MTDTGQTPEGAAREQAPPVAPAATAAYPFPGQPDEAMDMDGDEEELLMPGAIGAWGDAVVAPPQTVAPPPPVRPLAERAQPAAAAPPAAPAEEPAQAAPLDGVVPVSPTGVVPAQPGAWQSPPAPQAPVEATAPTAPAPPEAAEQTPEAAPPAAPDAQVAEAPPAAPAGQAIPVPPASADQQAVAGQVVAVPPATTEAAAVADADAPVASAPAPAAEAEAAVPAAAEPAVEPAEAAGQAPAPADPAVPAPPSEDGPAPAAEPADQAPDAAQAADDQGAEGAAVTGEATDEAPAPAVAEPAGQPGEATDQAPTPAAQPAEPAVGDQEPGDSPETNPPAETGEAAGPPAVTAGAEAVATTADPAPEANAPVEAGEAAGQADASPEPNPPAKTGQAAGPVPVPATADPAPTDSPEPNPPADTGEAAGQAVAGQAVAVVAYSDAEREAVHRLMRERRDVHTGFRADPIPHEVLLRVLEAAHTAPSIGLAQPWDFVIIRSEETRRTVHELAVRQRESHAAALPRARARQFTELTAEAVLDAPVNIVVTADPTRGGRRAAGPTGQPRLAPYSTALAVENLWLAARAEGLGVGLVGFLDDRELTRALGLPEHLEIVAYLCVGYVDAFPGEPEPDQGDPARRRPLSWVVHEESYGRRALPGAEPHDLLSETLAEIRPLDAHALGEAWERQKRMTKPAGALGALEVISAQLCGLSRACPPPVPEPAALAVFAGDHGVHAQGVTPWPQEVTAQMVANFLSGGAVCNAFATQVGAEVCVVDVGVRAELRTRPGLMPRKVRAGTADFTAGPAMSREEALRAVEVGIETARDLVAAGNRALLTGEMGIANTTVAAALIAVFTGAAPGEVTGRGTGVDDETHARKVDVVRRALQHHQPDPADPIGVLAAVGGLEHAALTGLILGGASLRVPVILDGVSAGAAALAARAVAPEAVSVCIAGHRSAEPGHMAALTALGLRPLVDLDLRLGEGTGALLALPVVQSAARAMREVATFDAAGVTDKN